MDGRKGRETSVQCMCLLVWLQTLWLVPMGLGIQGHLGRDYAQLPHPLGQPWWGHMSLLGSQRHAHSLQTPMNTWVWNPFGRNVVPRVAAGLTQLPPNTVLQGLWSLTHRPTASPHLVSLVLSKLNSAGEWSILYYNNAYQFFAIQDKM